MTLGFFEQMWRSDVFVLLDDVQYDKEGWRNRNRIKTAKGPQWLTVPVLTKGREGQKIYEVEINNGVDWRKKHLEAIRQNYSKAPFFKKYISLFEQAYALKWESLNDLNRWFISSLASLLGIWKVESIGSLTLGIKGDRIERLINLCHYFTADVFYEGAAGINYINEKVFSERGIKVEFQDYQHPVYPQLYGEFVSHLSVIDLLFNCGPESLKILTGGQK